MSRIEKAMVLHASERPLDVALSDGHEQQLSWRELVIEVERRVRIFRALGVEVLGIHCDNGVEWVLSDLAAHVARIPTVPIPKFFTAGQIAHVADTAAIETIVTDDKATCAELGFDVSVGPVAIGVWVTQRPSCGGANLDFQKVTFTSGTTGTPKGVCLDRAHLEAVAAQLVQASGSLPTDVHLCCLPLSILLENIAGIYRSVLAGGRIVAPPLGSVGFGGPQPYDPLAALAALRTHQATSAILVPEMLKGLVAFSGADTETKLRHLAVGGARVSPELLGAAQACGIPAYEGYGLSEFASVVAMNTPVDNCLGAAGKPLPHVDIRINSQGEIEINGPRFLGYLSEAGFLPPVTTADGYLPTGDLGRFDDDGFLHVTGRVRNVLITSFGRNISPEWVESELLSSPFVAHAVVFGDGEPQLSALMVVRGEGKGVEAHVSAVNRSLPDYARIGRCVVTTVPLADQPGLLLPGGGVARDAVAERFGTHARALDPDEKENTWAFTIDS